MNERPQADRLPADQRHPRQPQNGGPHRIVLLAVAAVLVLIGAIGGLLARPLLSAGVPTITPGITLTVTLLENFTSTPTQPAPTIPTVIAGVPTTAAPTTATFTATPGAGT